MKEIAGTVALWVAGIAVVALLIWGGTHASIWFYGNTEPKMENVRRNVFENTQSYVQGKVQEPSKLRREYKDAKDQTEKNALREMILSSASTVDHNNLPDDLRRFVEGLQ